MKSRLLWCVFLTSMVGCNGALEDEETFDTAILGGPSGMEWIHYWHHSPPQQSIHVAEVDLCAPNLEVRVTAPGEGFMQPSTFASMTGGLVTINGGHTFPEDGNQPGPTAHDGQFFGIPDRGDLGQAVFGDGLARLINMTDPYAAAPTHSEVVTGLLTLVQDGAEHPYLAGVAGTLTCQIHPRTLLGLTADRRKLILVVVDGRAPAAGRRGMSCSEAAQYMIARGARWALNMDGGGSSAMVVGGNVVNKPSDGSERPVGSHLSIVRTPGARGHCPSDPPPPPPPDACGRIVPGESLQPGQGQTSCNGKVNLVHQLDGNLVLYGPGGPLWYTATDGQATTDFVMQGDGNAVLFGPGGPLWATDTWGTNNAFIAVQNDGNLVVYSGDYVLWSSGTSIVPPPPPPPVMPPPPPPPPPATPCGVLPSGVALDPGQAVTSCDGRFRFVHQGDGNLVQYQGTVALWNSQTQGQGTDTLVMQDDGNLVLYDQGVPRWYTGTQGNPGARLVVQDDGNVVLYSSAGAVLWTTGTCCH